MLARYMDDVSDEDSDEEDSPVRFRRRQRRRKRRILLGLLYNYSQILGVPIALIYHYWRLGGFSLPHSCTRVFCNIGTTLSYILWAKARMMHAHMFSVRVEPSEAIQLITEGLYSRLSNPIYTFGSLCMLFFAFSVGSTSLLALAVAMTLVQIVRARREAVALKRRFGEEYDLYMRRVWF